MTSGRHLPPPAEVRAWETETGRGHAAAAEHFRASGYPDVDAEDMKRLYREAGKAKPRRQDPPPEPEAQPEPRPRSPEPQAGAALAPEPAPQPEPPALPAVVEQPHPADRDELSDLRLQYDMLWTLFKNASPRDAAPISRQMQQIRARLNEVEAQRKAASSKGLTTADRLKAMAQRMETWPDEALEVPVRIYLRRHGLRLWREGDGVVDRLEEQAASNREEDEDE